MTLRGERALAWMAWVVVCLVWGTTYLGIKVSLETIPPFLVGGLRYIAGGALLALVLRLNGRRLPRPSTWPAYSVMGLLLLGMGNGGVVWAEQYVSSGLAALVVATSPFWMIGMEAALPGGERLTRSAVIGLALGFAGVALLVGPDVFTTTGAGTLVGLLALQAACLGWALGSSYSRRRHTTEDAFGAAAVQMLAGGLAMLVAGSLLGEWRSLTFTARSATALAYLAVAGSLVGFAAYIYALRHLPVSRVSLYAYVNPVIAVVLGNLVLGERITWSVVAGMLTILVGMAVVSLSKRPGRLESTDRSPEQMRSEDRAA